MDERIPLVSVIVLSYNQENTIERTMKSILAQKGDFEMEVVVSDDCSSDRTMFLLKQIAEIDSRVKLLPAHEQLGVVGNYFHAFSRCKGKYIADCAGDDYWTIDGSLNKKVKALEENPDVAIAVTDWVVFSPDSPQERLPEGMPGSKIFGRMPGRKVLPHFLSGERDYMIHLSTALYRRDIIVSEMEKERSIIAREEFGNEDFPIIAALLNAGDVMHIGSCPSLAYCVGGDSVSNPTDCVKKADYFTRTAKMIAEIAEYCGYKRIAVRPVLYDKLCYAMKMARKSKDSEVVDRVRRACEELGITSSYYPICFFSRLYKR